MGGEGDHGVVERTRSTIDLPSVERIENEAKVNLTASLDNLRHRLS
jgi:hypothetical protein